MRSLILTSERLITPPAVEPVELALVKKNLRFSPTSEDSLIYGWVVAARQYFEHMTSRAVIAQTWEYGMQALPLGGAIELPRPPLLGVDSFVYLDGNGDEQIWDGANYAVSVSGVGSPSTTVVVDPFVARGRVELASGVSWPTVTGQMNAVKVRFTSGYGSTVDDVPELIKSCIYELVRHFHQRPDQEIPMHLQTTLRMFRQSAIDTIPLQSATVGAWL